MGLTDKVTGRVKKAAGGRPPPPVAGERRDCATV